VITESVEATNMNARRLLLTVLAVWLLAMPRGIPAAEPAVRAAAGEQDLQTPVFRAGVDAVRVNAIVTDRGRPVSGLQASDFEIRDNGVLQKTGLATPAEHAISVVLVLDTSGSVKGEKLANLKAAARALAIALHPGDAISLLTFSERVVRRVALSRDAGSISTALGDVDAGGRTALLDAVYAGLSMTAGYEGRSLLLVFSDGLDNASWLTQEQLLQSLKRSSVVTYAVTPPGFGTVLREMAAETGGEWIEGAADRRLADTFVKVLERFRGGYLLTYTPQGVGLHDGWHTLKVTVRGEQHRVRARVGYYSR
jgi:VWFA-related protein